MDDQKRGTIESYEDVYEPLKQFDVPARVWDDVLDEIFHEPFGTLAQPFQELLFELEVRNKAQADYPRPDGISDHDFVRVILRQAVAVFEAKGRNHARLMSDDGWGYDETLGVSIKPAKNPN